MTSDDSRAARLRPQMTGAHLGTQRIGRLGHPLRSGGARALGPSDIRWIASWNMSAVTTIVGGAGYVQHRNHVIQEAGFVDDPAACGAAYRWMICAAVYFRRVASGTRWAFQSALLDRQRIVPDDPKCLPPRFRGSFASARQREAKSALGISHLQRPRPQWLLPGRQT